MIEELILIPHGKYHLQARLAAMSSDYAGSSSGKQTSNGPPLLSDKRQNVHVTDEEEREKINKRKRSSSARQNFPARLRLQGQSLTRLTT
jgi:hypothetical protein